MRYPIQVDLLTPDRVKAFKLYAKQLGSSDKAARTIFAAGLHAVSVVGGMAKIAEDMLADRLARIVEADALLAERLQELDAVSEAVVVELEDEEPELEDEEPELEDEDEAPAPEPLDDAPGA